MECMPSAEYMMTADQIGMLDYFFKAISNQDVLQLVGSLVVFDYLECSQLLGFEITMK